EANGLIFWDLPSGKEFARRTVRARDLDDPLPFTRVLSYTPDGTRLVTGHVDTTALIWNAPARPKRTNALTTKERATAWGELAAADATKGWSAVWALADDPGAAAFLRDQIKPVEALP